jgi:hypothetical protein
MAKATSAVNMINTPQAPQEAAGPHEKKFSQRINASIQLIEIRLSQCTKIFTVLSRKPPPFSAALTNSIK